MEGKQDVIDQIIEAAGGSNNIEEIFHCISRIRMYCENNKKVDLDRLNRLPQVFEAK